MLLKEATILGNKVKEILPTCVIKMLDAEVKTSNAVIKIAAELKM